MSLLPGWEELGQYSVRAFHLERIPTDDPFDDAGEQEVYDTDLAPISGEKQDAKERVIAGVQTPTEYWMFYSGPDLPKEISEKYRLRVWDGEELLGDFDVRSRVEPAGEHVEIDAILVNA